MRLRSATVTKEMAKSMQDIEQKKLMAKLGKTGAELLNEMLRHDWFYMQSDDGRVYRRGYQHELDIRQLMSTFWAEATQTQKAMLRNEMRKYVEPRCVNVNPDAADYFKRLVFGMFPAKED